MILARGKLRSRLVERLNDCDSQQDGQGRGPDTYRMEFNYREAVSDPDYFQVSLFADT